MVRQRAEVINAATNASLMKSTRLMAWLPYSMKHLIILLENLIISQFLL